MRLSCLILESVNQVPLTLDKPITRKLNNLTIVYTPLQQWQRDDEIYVLYRSDMRVLRHIAPPALFGEHQWFLYRMDHGFGGRLMEPSDEKADDEASLCVTSSSPVGHWTSEPTRGQIYDRIRKLPRV